MGFSSGAAIFPFDKNIVTLVFTSRMLHLFLVGNFEQKFLENYQSNLHQVFYAICLSDVVHSENKNFIWIGLQIVEIYANCHYFSSIPRIYILTINSITELSFRTQAYSIQSNPVIMNSTGPEKIFLITRNSL